MVGVELPLSSIYKYDNNKMNFPIKKPQHILLQQKPQHIERSCPYHTTLDSREHEDWKKIIMVLKIPLLWKKYPKVWEWNLTIIHLTLRKRI